MSKKIYAERTGTVNGARITLGYGKDAGFCFSLAENEFGELIKVGKDPIDLERRIRSAIQTAILYDSPTKAAVHNMTAAVESGDESAIALREDELGNQYAAIMAKVEAQYQELNSGIPAKKPIREL